MAQLLIICPLHLGTQERWRRLSQELAGSRREQFEASCRQAGISQVQVWLVQLRRGELLLLRLHLQQPHQALQELANSQRPFEYWLRAQLQSLLGWTVQGVLPDQQELLFVWADESPGS
jgi:hypothetical protein